MKKTTMIGVFLTLFLPLFAQVSFQLRESDGVTSFNNRNIPVGTKLTVAVSSDSNDFWSGGLHLSGQYRSLGRLDAAGKDPNTLDWAGSRTTEAGPYALVMDWEDSNIQGFDLYSSDSNSAPGDWFILDYTALAPGESKIGFSIPTAKSISLIFPCFLTTGRQTIPARPAGKSQTCSPMAPLTSTT
jgi:hypothetical protein